MCECSPFALFVLLVCLQVWSVGVHTTFSAQQSCQNAHQKVLYRPGWLRNSLDMENTSPYRAAPSTLSVFTNTNNASSVQRYKAENKLPSAKWSKLPEMNTTHIGNNKFELPCIKACGLVDMVDMFKVHFFDESPSEQTNCSATMRICGSWL